LVGPCNLWFCLVVGPLVFETCGFAVLPGSPLALAKMGLETCGFAWYSARSSLKPVVLPGSQPVLAKLELEICGFVWFSARLSLKPVVLLGPQHLTLVLWAVALHIGQRCLSMILCPLHSPTTEHCVCCHHSVIQLVIVIFSVVVPCELCNAFAGGL